MIKPTVENILFVPMWSVLADARIYKSLNVLLLFQGFEFADLMKLKRVAKATKKTKDGKEPRSEGVISRQGSGLCFDFHAKDPNM